MVRDTDCMAREMYDLIRKYCFKDVGEDYFNSLGDRVDSIELGYTRKGVIKLLSLGLEDDK